MYPLLLSLLLICFKLDWKIMQHEKGLSLINYNTKKY